MAILTEDRNTAKREGNRIALPVKASTTIYGGGLVATDASGYAVSASDTAGLKIQGVAVERKINTGSSGDETVQVEKGVFNFSGTFTITDIGKDVYIVDDQTVSVSATTNSIKAGKIFEVASTSEAWIEIK